MAASLGACGGDEARRVDLDCDASTCAESDAAQEDGGGDPDGSQTGDSDTEPGDADAEVVPDGCTSELDCPLDCDADCATGPSAGFSLSASAGVIPLTVRATSTAQPGDAPIVSVRYDFTGAGFAAGDSHRYVEAGEYTVRQQVRDANGLSAEASLSVSVADFQPVRWSATDHDALVFLSPDRLMVENRGEPRGGARSDRPVLPGSGVFYFEAERLIDRPGTWGVGVATAQAPLDQQIGATEQSLGIDTLGQVNAAGATCTGSASFDASQRHYGFVVDYRATSARVHVVLEGATARSPVLQRSCITSLSAPLFIAYAGVRYAVGYQLAINTGSDITDFPFYFQPDDVRAALVAADLPGAAADLVPGFAQTRSPAPDAAPVLDAPADRTVAVGSTVQLSATARDAEDGDLTDAIIWADLSSQHHAPLTGTGGSFSFTASSIGRRPIAVSATDWDGVKTERIVMIAVTGNLPQPSPVRLVPDSLSGPNVELSTDGLQARFVDQGKYGIRANQGIYGQYWYFEGHREATAPENMGIGLVIPDGRLNPYDFVNVPWSCSINLLDSIWRNLVSQASYDTSQTHYGFAVDYRGLHPIVHFIVGGAYRTSLTLDDVWGPVYPMVYGDPPNERTTTWDVTVNFGASAFQLDPQTILSAQGIDTTGLELGWGDANTP